MKKRCLICGKILKDPFADGIYKNGIYEINNKEGIVDLKTGKILKRPFADRISDNGAYRINNKWGKISLKTGKILKKAI